MDIRKLATDAAVWRRESGKSMQTAIGDVLKQYSFTKNQYTETYEAVLRECSIRGGRKSRGTKRPRRQMRLQFG